eukprot:scaffold55131_cov27-Phaeocystis_antarctica.AAC.1
MRGWAAKEDAEGCGGRGSGGGGGPGAGGRDAGGPETIDERSQCHRCASQPLFNLPDPFERLPVEGASATPVYSVPQSEMTLLGHNISPSCCMPWTKSRHRP